MKKEPQETTGNGHEGYMLLISMREFGLSNKTIFLNDSDLLFVHYFILQDRYREPVLH